MQGGAVWFSFDGTYQDHCLLFMLGGSGVRLSHKDADFAPVLMFTNSKSITEFNFHLGSIPLLVHHLRPFRTYSSPSLCDYVFLFWQDINFLTNSQSISLDLTILAWMLVASDEATAGSVIPKHDLLQVKIVIPEGCRNQVQMLFYFSHQPSKTCAQKQVQEWSTFFSRFSIYLEIIFGTT